MLGQWARSKEPDVSLRASASGRADQIKALKQYSPMRIQAAVYRWYRVLLPDGTTGFIYEDSIEPVNETLETLEALANQEIQETPYMNAPTKEVLGTGDMFAVLGSYEGYWLIRTYQGNTGWLSIPSANLNDK
jgi:SH3-like domain-containing protein